MGFQIETGTATGRGFAGVDADGLLAKFYTWVTLAYASGGPAWYIHDDQSALGTNPYIVVTNTSSPTVNDYNTSPSSEAPIFLRVGMLTATAGQISIDAYMWWDNATQTGYGHWSHSYLQTYDDADFAYDFRGGTHATYGSMMILATRRGTAWNMCIVGEWEGNTDVLEAKTAVGTLQAGVTAGSSVVLQLDAGEAANFTANKFYFLYDFDGHSWVNYVKVTAVDAGLDQITVSAINQNFPAGAVICSYAHRQYQSEHDGNDIHTYTQNVCIPYVDRYGYEGDYADGFGAAPYHYGYCWVDTSIPEHGDPDDEGCYYCVRPLLRTAQASGYQTYGNRILGSIKNVYVCDGDGLAQMLDYRTIDSTDDWLCASNTTYDTLILNTESV